MATRIFGDGRKKLAGFGREIIENRSGFENRDRVAARSVMIDNCGNLGVWADFQKFGFELFPGFDTSRHDLVIKAAFFKHDMDFMTVRRRPGMAINHDGPPVRGG